VRDVELFTQTIAHDCQILLKTKVTVEAEFKLNGLNQTIITKVTM